MKSHYSLLRHVPIALVLGGAGVSMLACHGASSTEVTSAAVPVAKPPALPDADIAQAIDRHFQDERILRAAHIQARVTDGVATLIGSVDNLLAKERALDVTGTIRGVRSIVDEVTVSPMARPDNQLKGDVARALQRDVATRPFAIGVAAKDGIVTLSGTADSFQQRTMFEDVAKQIKGVKAVVDDVVLHYATTRPDAEIVADVKNRIANDVWLDGNPLGVTVSGHTAHLSGVVASVAQKSRASYDAKVAGIDAVDDSAVVVDWATRNDQRSSAAAPLRSDADIALAVGDALKIDPRLNTLIPRATVKNGVVELTGTVDSMKSRLAAEADARDTLGVWSVRDDVVVQPNGAPTDADIERSVRRVFKEDLLLTDRDAIHSSAAKGKVTLSGTVASGFDRFDAVADVSSLPGVREIDDALVVKRSPTDIKASIDDRLFWDPVVERDHVIVTVASDGVATLRGTLDSWAEIKAAIEDARLAGASRVVSVLALKGHPELMIP